MIIIGGGPAGLSALLWCADLGLHPILIEKAPETGGQLLSIYNKITNYPGLLCENGRDLRDRFMESLAGVEYSHILDAEVTQIDVEAKRVELADGREIEAQALIIATGVRRRKLGVKGENKFAGKGILESGTKDPSLAAGKRVAVIGGGDAALENALLLSQFAEKVFLIHRGEKLSARSEFIDEALAHHRIEYRPNTIIHAFRGGDRLEKLELEKTLGKSKFLEVQLALVRIGVLPNTDLVKNKLEVDKKGYVVVNNRYETSVGGIFAIGDVANPTAPTISTATGTAAIAVKQLVRITR